ncbi:MAG: S8 family serine peptidase [Bacteroidales bacterium]|nr:S8 family serine peptidase [Bacteroidales bacterium]
MKNIYRLIFTTALIAASLTACSVEEPVTGAVKEPQKVSPVSDDAVAGELLVRFDEGVSEILDQAGLITKSGESAASRSGVLTVDEILDLVEGYQIERVFPVDMRSEEKMREEGLHLWYVVRFSDKYPVEKVAADLARLGEVSRVEFNRTLKRANQNKAVPLSADAIEQMAASAKAAKYNDPHLPLQWHMVNNGDLGNTKFVAGADVNVEKAWELCTGNPSIIVAVLDEGVDFSHPDLKANMWVNEKEIWRSSEDNDGNGYAGDVYGYNFAAQSGIISTNGRYDTGHGTHVAGVIAAANNNGIGISSIAGGTAENPGVKIMSCQIFSGALAGTVLDEVRAIKYAADNGAVILQCSWGYISGAANPYDWQPQFSSDDQWKNSNMLEYKALDYFVHNAGSPDGVVDGGIIVFAGGNEYAPAASYPAAYPDYVSVAATAPDYTPAVYTNYGPGTTICAPGGDQDYYFEYGEGLNKGSIGCVLSTLPYNVTGTASPLAGYGYMEGTSMACPHVSGVVALGLSYAANLHKHVKAEEVKELLHSTARPVEQYWNLDTPKQFYKFVTDLSEIHLSSMNLKDYRGKMGSGQVDAHAFLQAIAGVGVDMTFPNLFIALDGQVTIAPAMYFKNGGKNFEVTISDSSVAAYAVEGSKLVFFGEKEGQTSAVIKSDSGESFPFTITVRKSAASNGWL